MGFRDDGDALRNRVDALEGELARAKEETERARQERDRALAGPTTETPPGRRFGGTTVWIFMIALMTLIVTGAALLLARAPVAP